MQVSPHALPLRQNLQHAWVLGCTVMAGAGDGCAGATVGMFSLARPPLAIREACLGALRRVDAVEPYSLAGCVQCVTINYAGGTDDLGYAMREIRLSARARITTRVVAEV